MLAAWYPRSTARRAMMAISFKGAHFPKHIILR
jgi:hypothetical protein